MTVLVAAALPRADRHRGRALAEATLVVAALAAIVLARAGATNAGLDPLLLGVAFGAGLLLIAGLRLIAGSGGAAARLRTWHPSPNAIAAGVVVGLGLVAIGFAAPALAGAAHAIGLGRPSAAFVPWAAVTVLVAAAEEAVLRGVLFDRIRSAGGLLAAVLVTAIAFALLHVPLYGWHVVPLDLAVGLALGGLRVATGGILAPAVAHAVADLATWWL